MTAAPAEHPTRDWTTAALLLEWDRTRPRSQQVELGMSEVGVCRKRAGYRIAGTAPSNPGSSVQAVMGTAVHAAAEAVHRQLQEAGLIPAEDLIEHEVRYAGILGHLDRYEPGRARLCDIKTTSSRWLDHIRVHGPEQAHLWQTNLYAAALIIEGRKVREIVIDYLARDTGDEYRWTGRPDPQMVRAALEWLRNVRDQPLAWLPRDHEPGSGHCRHCPFLEMCWPDRGDRDRRVVLYTEDPDAPAWAEKLWRAREDKRAAAARESEAKGALDALRPNIVGSATVDVGWERALRWTVATSQRLDSDAVRREYADAGAEPPTKESTSTTLTFAALEPTGAAS